jgi:GTP-binding protein
VSEDGIWVDESDWESTEFVDSIDDVASGPPPVVAVVGRPNVGKS